MNAYAYTGKDGGSLWLADFQLNPDGYRGTFARHGQHALEIRLTGKGGLTRGRYKDRRAQLVVHDESGAQPSADKIDLVIETVDKTWVCGQLLDPDPKKRQPFAARIAQRLY